MTAVLDSPRTPVRRRSSGKQRRKLIIDATLRIVAHEGVRAVRHRAVAAEADVPLAATTYYFRDIAELLRESLETFAAERDASVDAFSVEFDSFVQSLGTVNPQDVQARRRLAEEVSAIMTAYVQSQIAEPEQRTIELAFRHEAQREPLLMELITAQDERFCAHIERALTKLGCAQPRQESELLYATLLWLEGKATFAGMPSEAVHGVLHRFFTLIFHCES